VLKVGHLLSIIVLCSAMLAFALPSVSFIAVDECCCTGHDKESSPTCPCDPKEGCCTHTAAVIRAPWVAESKPEILWSAPAVYRHHVCVDTTAMIRHEAPALPPPKNRSMI
jgi:hypothetical protein